MSGEQSNSLAGLLSFTPPVLRSFGLVRQVDVDEIFRRRDLEMTQVKADNDAMLQQQSLEMMRVKEELQVLRAKLDEHLARQAALAREYAEYQSQERYLSQTVQKLRDELAQSREENLVQERLIFAMQSELREARDLPEKIQNGLAVVKTLKESLQERERALDERERRLEERERRNETSANAIVRPGVFGRR